MISYTRKMLVMFGVCGFLPPFIARSIDLALPALAQEFDMNIIALSWVITAYLLTTAALIIPFGRLADIVGRKKIFIAGTSLFTLTTILCGLAYSGPFLIAARTLQGAASAMIFGTANALLISLFSAKERSKAFAINVSGIYLGSSLGPSLGGVMTQYFGWRSLFALTTILSLFVVTIAWMYLNDEKTEAHGESFDSIGSILYASSMITFLYGITMLPAFTGFVVIAVGTILFGIFSVIERYVQHPLFDSSILCKNRTFGALSIAALCNFTAAFAVTFLLSLFLQYIKGLPPTSAGLILLMSPLTIFIGSPIAGKLSEKIDSRIIASRGMICSSVALLVMALTINAQTSPYTIMLLLFIFGVGVGLFASPNTNAAMSSVEKKQAGVAASVINSMRLFGQAMSMGITTLILCLYVNKHELCCASSLPQLMRGIQIALFVLGLICIMGIVASRASYRTPER